MSKSGRTSPLPSILSQTADMQMQMTLRQVGFGAASANAMPYVPPKSAPAPRDDSALALKRRDWLLHVMEQQRALSPYASGLLTADALSGEDFLHNFYAPYRPALIKGAMEGWPAREKWTPDYLADAIGDAQIEYQGGRTKPPTMNWPRTGTSAVPLPPVHRPGARWRQ
ncbi:hypothetical protein ACFSUK_29330 [Sphingobium scionense]